MPAALDIGSLGVAIDIDDKGNPRDFDLKVASIAIPPEVFAQDPQQKAILDELGYTSGFTVNLNVAGAYETEGDVLTLRGFTLDTVDVGKLAIAGTSDETPWYTNQIGSTADTGGKVFLSSSSAWPNTTTWTITCRPLTPIPM